MEPALLRNVDKLVGGHVNDNHTFSAEVLRLGAALFTTLLGRLLNLLLLGHQLLNLLLQLHLLGLDALVEGLPAALNIAVYDHLAALVRIEGLADGALRDVVRLLLPVLEARLQGFDHLSVQPIIDTEGVYLRRAGRVSDHLLS